MKRIVYSFFLISILSCGRGPVPQAHRIRLQFRDSTSHEFYLLSVRNDALIVVPGYYKSDGPPQSIPFSNLDHAYYNTNGKTDGMWLGGLIGCTASTATVLVIGLSQGPDKLQDGLGLALGGAFIAMPAIAAGMIVGYCVSNDEDGFDLSKAHDRDALRELSKYPDREPPELQEVR